MLGTVPVNNFLLTGNVPVNNFYHILIYLESLLSLPLLIFVQKSVLVIPKTMFVKRQVPKSLTGRFLSSIFWLIHGANSIFSIYPHDYSGIKGGRSKKINIFAMYEPRYQTLKCPYTKKCMSALVVLDCCSSVDCTGSQN